MLTKYSLYWDSFVGKDYIYMELEIEITFRKKNTLWTYNFEMNSKPLSMDG